jgi:cytochrome c556
MKRTITIVAVVLATIGALGLASRGDDKEPKSVKALMHKKLHSSQKILEGITLNDFKTIANNAEDLIDISKQTEWRVLKTPQYEVHSNEFRRNAENLIKNSKDKNLDAAALSYVELTLTCVRCHKYVREERMVRLER